MPSSSLLRQGFEEQLLKIAEVSWAHDKNGRAFRAVEEPLEGGSQASSSTRSAQVKPDVSIVNTKSQASMTVFTSKLAALMIAKQEGKEEEYKAVWESWKRSSRIVP